MGSNGSIRAASALALGVAALLGVAGCGGGHAADPPAKSKPIAIPADTRAQPGGAEQSGVVVARVGTVPIRQSAVESRIKMEVQSEAPSKRVLPVPPRYESCISTLAAAATHAGGQQAPSHVELADRCRAIYDTLLHHVLGTLISYEWVIGEASEDGLGPTELAVQRRLEHLEVAQFGSGAGFRRFLTESDENVPNLLFTIKYELAETLLHHAIEAKTVPATPEIVAQYYDTHRHTFFVKEQRDLGLIRTKSLAGATRVKQELESGTSFDRVASKLANSQPIYTNHGLLKGLEPGVYAEKNLNDAIFSAPRGRVSGPVPIHLERGFHFKSQRDIENIDGYYVFTVLRIRPAYTKPLAEVKGTLTKQLPELLRHRAIVNFVKAWRAKWATRTTCKSGYVVKKCREFVPSGKEPPEDPYTIF